MTEQPPAGQPQPHPYTARMSGVGCTLCDLMADHSVHVGEPISRSVQRRQGQTQPRLYRTVDEEREFREAKEKYGLKDHWPQGQPQSSTAASADEVERRRRADSTAIEQGRPQQEPADQQHHCENCGHQFLDGSDFDCPKHGALCGACYGAGQHWDCKATQERQAGGHQRGELYENYRNLEQTIYRCSCARGWHDADFWQGFDAGYEKAMLDAIASHPKKKGVADAAAQTKP